MILRDKTILKKAFVEEAFSESLKLAMLEYFPELEAKVIHSGVNAIRRDVLDLKPQKKERVIQ